MSEFLNQVVNTSITGFLLTDASCVEEPRMMLCRAGNSSTEGLSGPHRIALSGDCSPDKQPVSEYGAPGC